jgi:hypothetical protein
MKKVVKILRPWGIHSPGDIAGFEVELADRLIEGKVAAAHEEKAGEKVEKSAEEKPKAAK